MKPHIFSFYCEELSSALGSKSDCIELKDTALWERITQIVRLEDKQECILFDNTKHCFVRVLPETFKQKRKVVAAVVHVKDSVACKPPIIVCAALLKRSFFEGVVYVAAQMGATKIIPLLTNKVHKNWIGFKDCERLKKIMIAACEQAKNFIIPTLHEPCSLNQDFLLSKTFDGATKICFDKDGESISGIIHHQQKQLIALFVGPEGGFVEQELCMIKECGGTFYRLTPTILRSIEAVTVGLGVVRSLIS